MFQLYSLSVISSPLLIAGKHFAVSITHAAKYLIFFTCRSVTVLLFKSED